MNRPALPTESRDGRLNSNNDTVGGTLQREVSGRETTIVLAVGAVLFCAGCVANHSAVVNNDYSSLSKLPDWSGIWVLTYHGGAEEASRDSMGPDGNGNVPVTQEYAQLRVESEAKDTGDNLNHCLPAGPTAVLQHGILFEFLFNPGRVTMLFEDGEERRIHTDGRSHRPLADLTSSYMGDSVGHWDGSALVVDTIGFQNGQIWQNGGVKATKNTHLVERMFLRKDGQLEIDNTITDPGMFTRPYTYTRLYKHSSLTLDEPVCAANQRDTGTSVDLTPPPEE